MPSNKKKTNVVPFLRDGVQPVDLTKVDLALEKLKEAIGLSEAKQIAKAQQALKISSDCTPAHMFLADRAIENERIEHLRGAVKSCERLLGADWETRYLGIFWVEEDTRPLMRCMITLAFALQTEGELDEALTIYRKLMKMCPNDNVGARYLFATCLCEANLAKELDKLLVEYKDDSCAVLLYTKALHLFKKGGPNPAADKALLEAFEQNPYVPLALSDIVEMAESNGYVGVGDETEAVSYAEDHGYLWYDTEGSINWFASVVEAKMFEHFEDKEMVQDVLKELRSL